MIKSQKHVAAIHMHYNTGKHVANNTTSNTLLFFPLRTLDTIQSFHVIATFVLNISTRVYYITHNRFHPTTPLHKYSAKHYTISGSST